MKTVNIILNTQKEEESTFILSAKSLKKIAISAEYHISKFLDLFNFCEKDLEKFTLLLRKTVICFECIDSQEKLGEKSLLSKKKFFSKLDDKGISDRNYKHAQKVTNAFSLKVIKILLYNMQDVLISFAVNVDFMKNMSAKFNLNPLSFVTFGSFSLECALKINKIELGLLTDVNIILDCENGIRGGIKRAIFYYV